jgi:hypothetical protein
VSDSSLRVLFRVAAGPRVGFGHLVRARSLAAALGVPVWVSIRGSADTRRVAATLGCDVVDDVELPNRRCAVMVVDDPSPRRALPWVHRARQSGLLAVTISDLGLGAVESDLAVDGSIEPHATRLGLFDNLYGPAYAILDPSIATARGARPAGGTDVLVALGGGAHVGVLAARLCRAIAARVPDVRIRVASGFVAGPRPVLDAGDWIESTGGLAAELAAARVAVVAGGVTLYEACAIGVPAVGLALTPAQRRTVQAFAARGAALEGGFAPDGAGAFERTAEGVLEIMSSARVVERLALSGQHLVDGRGATRVAARIRALSAAAANRLVVDAA